ncbi:MAG TPA: hypothetical protein VH590_03315 [Ktedonobacterales bacterium]|jgi:ABC-type nickel/cobalt efflux system permease component RcnA
MQARTSYPISKTTRNGRGRGALVGFIPLALLAGIMGLALALTALVRGVTDGQGVAAEKTAPLLTLAVGLVMAVVTSIVALARVWRRMRAWQQAGDEAPAFGAFWALAVTGLLVLLPFVLALVWPQHPVP